MRYMQRLLGLRLRSVRLTLKIWIRLRLREAMD